MLNSKDIPYVREERLHNEMKFLSEKRNYLYGRLKESRGKNKNIPAQLREIETQVCYVYRELERRRLRREAHASYLKKKNHHKNRDRRDNNSRNNRDNNYRKNRDNRANRPK